MIVAGKAQGVERHVVLAHELDIAHVVRALVGAPPAFPVGLVLAVAHRPIRRWRRCIRSARRTRRRRPCPPCRASPRSPLLHRHAPVEIAGDAAVLQPVAVVQPFPGDRGGQDRPVGLAVDPGVQPVAHRRLAQVEVLGLAHLQIGRARDRRARVDQVGRVELLGAVLALVAAGAVVAAIGAGALDVAVGQEAAVGDGIDLLLDHFARSARCRPACRRNAGSARGSAATDERPKWSKDSRKPRGESPSGPRASRRSIRPPACRPWRRPARPGCRARRWRR